MELWKSVAPLHPNTYDLREFSDRPSVLYSTHYKNHPKNQFHFVGRCPGRRVKYREEGGMDPDFGDFMEKHCPFETRPKYRLTRQTDEIGYKQTSNFGVENNVVIEQKLVDRALDLFVPLVGVHLKTHFRSLPEVIPRLNPTTACGWPLSSRFRIKHDFKQWLNWQVVYAKYFSMMAETSYPPSVYTSNVKFELRTHEKVLNDEARTFMPCPMFTQILWMQYLSAYDDSIAASTRWTPFCLGYSDKYDGATNIAHYLTFHNETSAGEIVEFFEWDITGWDRSIQVRLIDIAWQAMRMSFPPEYRTPAHEQRLKNMMHDMIYTPIMLEHGDVFETVNGIKSGHPGTLTINSLIHIMIVLMAIVSMKPDITPDELRRSFRFKVQGDDGLGSRVVQRSKWFSEEKFKSFFVQCGLLFKHFKRSFDLSTLEFLGGNLTKTAFGTWVSMPNRLKIIDAMFFHKNTDPRCVLSKLLSLRIAAFPDYELFRFVTKWVEWYEKKHDALLKIPFGETVDGEYMFTYEKLKAQFLPEAAVRAIYYGFQMDTPTELEAEEKEWDVENLFVGKASEIPLVNRASALVADEGETRWMDCRYGMLSDQECKLWENTANVGHDDWRTQVYCSYHNHHDFNRALMLNDEENQVIDEYESKHFSEPRLNDNIRNKRTMSTKVHKHPSQKAKAGLITKEELKVLRKAERKLKREKRKLAKTAPIAATTAVSAAAVIREEKKIAKKANKGKGKAPAGYPGVFDALKTISHAPNRMQQHSRGKDESTFGFNGNLQGYTFTTDSASPPTLMFNGTLQTIRVNAYTLGDTVRTEAQNWYEYQIELMELWLVSINGIANTPGVSHMGTVDDAAYIVASGQSITKDFVDTLKNKVMTAVYNQEKPPVMRYKHDTKRVGREWFKNYASSQQISSAPVIAEVRETYQLAIVGFPENCTPSTQLGSFGLRLKIKFRGWKTPVALVRESIDNSADAIVAHHANQCSAAHEEYHKRVRNGEKNLVPPPMLFHPSQLPVILAEILRYSANMQYLTGSEKKVLGMLVGIYNSIVSFKSAVRDSVAKQFVSKFGVGVGSGDVPVSAIPVVVVDPSVASDPRIAGLSSALKVSSAGGLSADARLMASDRSAPMTTLSSDVMTAAGAVSGARVYPTAPLGANYVGGSMVQKSVLYDQVTGKHVGEPVTYTHGANSVLGYLPDVHAVSGVPGSVVLQTGIQDSATQNTLKIQSNGTLVAQIGDDASPPNTAIVSGVGNISMQQFYGTQAVVVGTSGQLFTAVTDSAGVNFVAVGTSGQLNTTICDKSNAGTKMAVSLLGGAAVEPQSTAGNTLRVGTAGELLTAVCDYTTTGNRIKVNADGSHPIAGSSNVVIPSTANNSLQVAVANATGAFTANVYSDGSLGVGGAAQQLFNQSTAGTMRTIVATAAQSSDSKFASSTSSDDEAPQLTGPEKAQIKALMAGGYNQDTRGAIGKVLELCSMKPKQKRAKSAPKSRSAVQVAKCATPGCGHVGEFMRVEGGWLYVCPKCGFRQTSGPVQWSVATGPVGSANSAVKEGVATTAAAAAPPVVKEMVARIEDSQKGK